MKRTYSVLAIDDEVQIKSYFEMVTKLVKKNFDLDIIVDIVNEDQEYDESKIYDIILIDYNLGQKFDKFADGKDLISKLRSSNKVCKLIFYSSEFEYSEDTKTFKIPLECKAIYDLINVYRIDGLVDKGNFKMMQSVLKEACHSVDIVTDALYSTISRYSKMDFDFKDSDGNIISSEEMIKHLLSDSNTARKFKEEILDTVFTLFMNIKE